MVMMMMGLDNGSGSEKEAMMTMMMEATLNRERGILVAMLIGRLRMLAMRPVEVSF